MQKKYLMTPGPTPVPAEVLLTHGRADDPPPDAGLLGGVHGGRSTASSTSSRPKATCCCSRARAPASWSPRSSNCFCAGDTVIVTRNGKFGDRRSRSAEVYGLNVIDLAYEWTEVVDPADVATALEENPDVRGVIVTQSETSSGVLNDVEGDRRDRRRATPTACSSSTRSPASARSSARPTSGASTWS